MNRIKSFLYLLLGGLLICSVSYAAKSSGDAHQGFIGKPHAPVEMTYVLPDKIAATKKLIISATLTAMQDVDALDVRVRFDEGLQAISKQQLNFGRSGKKQSNQFDIECVAQRNGLFYVHVLTTLTIDGQQQSRSFTIPVNVGNVDVRKQLKASGVVKQDASGERIISMPAQESSRPAK